MNIPSLNGNWVDLIILAVFAFFVVEAVRSGFWAMMVDFVSFFISLLVALRGYSLAAYLLKTNFNLGRSLANALGFLVVAVITEAVLGTLLAKLVVRLPGKYSEGKWNRFLGIVPGVGEAAFLIAFVLTILLSFPVAPTIKSDIAQSKIGGFLVKKTAGLEVKLSEVFGGIVEESLTYLTVKPGSRESISLDVKEPIGLSVDEQAESEMFALVNQERRKVGVGELSWDPEVVAVARDYARDMWERGYFGHVSPEGEDVGDRLERANIYYTFAGENLALAPTVATAHTGLMNSEGHRANILDARFKKVGIGVIDNGIYGKMFVQVFTD